VAPHPKFKRDNYDVFVDQAVPFSVATLGGQVSVTTLDGQLKLKVRPGTASHTLVRVRGEGVQHLQSRGKGDLYVRLVVTVPEKLTAGKSTWKCCELPIFNSVLEHCLSTCLWL
jgi:molecular chaperone DnaJ